MRYYWYYDILWILWYIMFFFTKRYIYIIRLWYIMTYIMIYYYFVIYYVCRHIATHSKPCVRKESGFDRTEGVMDRCCLEMSGWHNRVLWRNQRPQMAIYGFHMLILPVTLLGYHGHLPSSSWMSIVPLCRYIPARTTWRRVLRRLLCDTLIH